MALNYNNPNDWGKSPLTDFALRMQQFRAENPEVWNRIIENDLIFLTEHKTIYDPLVADEEEYTHRLLEMSTEPENFTFE